MSVISNPLIEEAPAEVPLAEPPLIRVIAQVRFPMMVALRNEQAIIPIQEALRPQYPVLRPETSQSVTFGPNGPQEATTMHYWRFHDKRDEWIVSLGPDFVGIETSRYKSREDFLSRFQNVLEVCWRTFHPPAVDRIGLRFINRVAGIERHELRELIRPEVLGIAGTPLADQAEHAIAQNVFTLPSGNLAARWGLIPPGKTADPSAIDPIDQPSWVLDLDAYSLNVQNYSVEELIAESRQFAERIYAFFRWVVTPEFLSRYGGKA